MKKLLVLNLDDFLALEDDESYRGKDYQCQHDGCEHRATHFVNDGTLDVVCVRHLRA